MFKNRFAVIALTLAALSLIGCAKEIATLKVALNGAKNSPVVLSLLNFNKLEVVDTLNTNSEGEVKFKVKLPQAAPNFYYISYNGKVLSSIMLSPGDKVELKADTLGGSLSVSGSKEAELYAQIAKDISRAQKQFDSLTVQLFALEDAGDEAGAQEIRNALGKLYVKEKQSSIVKLVENPNSFTNVTLLYRQFNENLPLFASLTDGIYFMQVADSLKKIYPNSPYVKALENEAREFGNTMEMRERIRKAGEVVFPEIVMNDVNSNEKVLSDLLGKPFILLFWSAEETSHKMLNAELETIYKKFSSKGLEIFSVCCDTDRTFWAQVVKRLPWINVCDGKGTSSPALQSYNVAELPAMYVFDREGNIVARDAFDLKKLEAIVSGL